MTETSDKLRDAIHRVVTGIFRPEDLPILYDYKKHLAMTLEQMRIHGEYSMKIEGKIIMIEEHLKKHYPSQKEGWDYETE